MKPTKYRRLPSLLQNRSRSNVTQGGQITLDEEISSGSDVVINMHCSEVSCNVE